MNFSFLLPALVITTLALPSCSSVKTTMKKMGAPVGTFAKTSTQRLKDLGLSGLKPRDSKIPPIVKVRREDLREVQLGSEKVLAWSRSKEQGGGVVYLPIDFNPADLPVGGQLPSSGILPPLNPGAPSPEGLPDDITNLPDLSSSDFDSPPGE